MAGGMVSKPFGAIAILVGAGIGFGIGRCVVACIPFLLRKLDAPQSLKSSKDDDWAGAMIYLLLPIFIMIGAIALSLGVVFILF